MTENYADHPKSIAEIRSDKSRSASDWTPRDALIATLRDIDSGAIDPDALVIAYRHKSAPMTDSVGWRASSPKLTVTLGLLQWVMHRVLAD